MTSSNESSTAKSSSTLSSSDLVSRFIAATPSYLYDASPMQNDFYFSEMLRSLVQAKHNSSVSQNSALRRRKRCWKDSRERPLELITKERSQNQCHPSSYVNNLPYQQNIDQILHSQEKSHSLLLEKHRHASKTQLSNVVTDNNSPNNNYQIDNVLNIVNKVSEQSKRETDDFNMNDNNFRPKIESPSDYQSKNDFFFNPTKIKIDVPLNMQNNTSSPENDLHYHSSPQSVNDQLSPNSERLSKFRLKNNLNNSSEISPTPNFNIPNNAAINFLHKPLWHPQYFVTDNYPFVDPLHFFIDLRVTGQIWDQKSNKQIFNKNNQNSAFNVPESKEYSKPLNLTTNEATNCRYINKNLIGTHYILKYIKQTYEKIWDEENHSRMKSPSKNFDETKVSDITV